MLYEIGQFTVFLLIAMAIFNVVAILVLNFRDIKRYIKVKYARKECIFRCLKKRQLQ